jgi:hypothetical protein
MTGSKTVAQPLDTQYEEPESKDVRSIQSDSIQDYAGKIAEKYFSRIGKLG